jgi:hypothetical protein
MKTFVGLMRVVIGKSPLEAVYETSTSYQNVISIDIWVEKSNGNPGLTLFW